MTHNTQGTYYTAQCPHCRRQVGIILQPAEAYTGRCLCPHRRVTVKWVDDKPTLQAQEEAK